MIADLSNSGVGDAFDYRALVAKCHRAGQTPVYAIDFETYYDNECSVTTIGQWHYFRHPLSDIYLVSIAGPEGEWVGNPLDFDWSLLNGAIWLSHNASFDTACWEALKEKHPDEDWGTPSEWHCTSDLSAYMGSGRSLKEAAKVLLGLSLSKDTRDKMKGKRWSDMTPEFRAEVEQYALSDAWRCWELWMKYSDGWPAVERKLSLLTRQMGWEGVATDVPRLEEALVHLRRLMWESEQQIPWSGKKDPKNGEPIKLLSAKALAEHCAQVGIAPPKSLAKDSEELEEWLNKYGDTYPWVKAMSNFRRYNALAEKFNTTLIRTRQEFDGRMGYELKYFGAHTGRWSGGGGWNPQNLQREPFYIHALTGHIIVDEAQLDEIAKCKKDSLSLPAYVRCEVDLRRCIVAPKGKKFIVVDLSQIEPRALSWLIGDDAAIKLMATGMSPYEVHARLSMGWSGGNLKEIAKTDPIAKKLYQLAKARVLALGYGAGWFKFYGMALTYGVEPTIFDDAAGLPHLEDFQEYLQWLAEGSATGKAGLKVFTESDDVMRLRYTNCWRIVNDFRETNPLIADKSDGLWGTLDQGFRRSVNSHYRLELPSGRELRYQHVISLGGWTAEIVKNGRKVREKFYGGKLTENLVQATARDVFGEAKLRVAEAGYKVVLSVHDEAVVEVDEDETPDRIQSLFTQTPEWLPGCPIDSEPQETFYYCK